MISLGLELGELQCRKRPVVFTFELAHSRRAGQPRSVRSRLIEVPALARILSLCTELIQTLGRSAVIASHRLTLALPAPLSQSPISHSPLSADHHSS